MNILTIRHKQAPDHPMIPRNRWALGVLAAVMLVLTLTVSPFKLTF